MYRQKSKAGVKRSRSERNSDTTRCIRVHSDEPVLVDAIENPNLSLIIYDEQGEQFAFVEFNSERDVFTYREENDDNTLYLSFKTSRSLATYLRLRAAKSDIRAKISDYTNFPEFPIGVDMYLGDDTVDLIGLIDIVKYARRTNDDDADKTPAATDTVTTNTDKD